MAKLLQTKGLWQQSGIGVSIHQILGILVRPARSEENGDSRAECPKLWESPCPPESRHVHVQDDGIRTVAILQPRQGILAAGSDNDPMPQGLKHRLDGILDQEVIIHQQHRQPGARAPWSGSWARLFDQESGLTTRKAHPHEGALARLALDLDPALMGF